MTDDRPRFLDVARPDERTVQKVARDESAPVPPPPRRWRRRGPPEVTSLRVNSEVWETAKSLTPDPRCIQIISDEEVIVWNHRPPWPGPGRR